MPAAGVDARENANEPSRPLRGSLLVGAGRALVVAGVALVGLAVLLAVTPVTGPRGGPSGADRVACGVPVVAVSRADPGPGVAGLERLAQSDPGGAGEPSDEDLARLEELERDVEWYRACHRPAASRMVGANALVAVGAVATIAGAVARRRWRAAAAASGTTSS